MGLRATLGAALSAAVLSRLGAVAGVPVVAWLQAVTLAMSSALLVGERGPAAFGTMLLLPLPATAAVALASVAWPIGPVGAAVAVPVLYGAVAARRYGPRGHALGMAAFLAFFVALYFKVPPRQLLAVAASMAIATALACAARFGLVPDRPRREASRAARAVRHAVARELRELVDTVRARHPPARLDARLRRATDRLHASALALDGVLERAAAAPGAEVLRERLFELQLAAERTVLGAGQMARSGALPAEARRAFAGALAAARGEALRRARRDDAAASLAAARATAAGAPPPGDGDARRLSTALADVVSALPRFDLAVVAAAPLLAPPPPPSPRQATTRQAVQATLAGGLAMAAGHALSPTRWYWAVIAAFVVFTRAVTVADTMRRAWLRLLGTVAGAVAGAVLAHALGHDRRVLLGAAFACVFFAYYLFRVSYAWMIFWFTALLAVLYRLLGRFTPELLALRLAETALGVGIGALIAATLWPVATGGRVLAAAARVLRAFARYLDASVTQRARGAKVSLLGAARAQDAALGELRARAQPFLRAMLPTSRRAAGLVHAATSLVFFARHLAPDGALTELCPDERAAVAEAGARLTAAAEAMAQALEEGLTVPAMPPATPLIALAAAGVARRGLERRGPSSAPVWLYWLEQVDEALSDVSELARAAPRRVAR